MAIWIRMWENQTIKGRTMNRGMVDRMAEIRLADQDNVGTREGGSLTTSARDLRFGLGPADDQVLASSS